MVVINRLTLITLIISSNFLLSSHQENPAKETSQIKITPLHVSELDNQQQDQTPPDNINQAKNTQGNPHQKTINKPLIKPAQWILESSIENAPELLKGIFFYLLLHSHCADESQLFMTIPSCHRFILVGPPGSGKTTLAQAVAHMLGYPIIFIPATGLLGRFRNETANNIENCLREQASDRLKKVIIIDELHKLFEHHTSDHSDDSQSAAAFWLALDDIEKRSPNIIFIGTANNVNKLPPEIKSRFSGKVITMPTPNKNQKIQAFKNSVEHDLSIVLDRSVNDAFIAKMIQQRQDCSMRDVQLIIDTAKMFYYADRSPSESFIILTRAHFQQALDQLQAESNVLQENFSDRLCKKLGPWGIIFGIAANACILTRASSELLYSSPQFLKKIQLLYLTNTNLLNNNTPLNTL